jgi:tRNA-uridine 2-sulfurtransferase
MSDSIRCVGLLSGGLDSTLATRWMLDQGLDVRCINFRSPFCTCTAKGATCSAAVAAARSAGDVPLEVQTIGDDYLEMVKHPVHGRGRAMNPCLDCRIFKFRRAWEYAESIGARFLFTGEVLGQRPMSQRRHAMIDVIDRHSGLEGLILRPLSAQRLPETVPEQRGWVDRDAMLDLSGRSRKPQMAMADEMGITDYPCAAGGCLLTDRGFAARLSDLFEHHPDCTAADVQPLKLGRHFRTEDGIKLVVGRNHGENLRLQTLAPAGVLAVTVDVPGPTVLAQDGPPERLVELAGDLLFGHASLEDGVSFDVQVTVSGEEPTVREHTPSATRQELRARMEPWRL